MICVLCAVACRAEAGTSGRKGDFPVEVRTVVMEKSPDFRIRSYVGQAKASRSAVLYSPYPGRLVSLDARKGNRVGRVEVVAEIYSESVRSSYDMSQAVLRQAEDGYERVLKVYEKGGVSEVRLKEVETSLAKARAGAAAAGDALESCLIRAPFDGVVSDVFAHQGTEVTAVEPLLKIVDASAPEIAFQVPEGELSGIIEGASALVDIPALDREGLPAKVVSKGVEASPVSHTYECSLRLSESLPGLAPGMVCKVALVSDLVPNHVVPAELVHTDRDGRYVWTVRDGVVHKRRVVIGGYAGSGVIITEGLENGEQVISEGFRKVSSGMKVKVQE